MIGYHCELISDVRSLPGRTCDEAYISTVKTVEPDESVTLNCRLSSPTYSNPAPCLSLQKPGEAPKLLICGTNSLQSGTPSRFSGSGSNTDLSLKICKILTQDVGDYYCQSVHKIAMCLHSVIKNLHEPD